MKLVFETHAERRRVLKTLKTIFTDAVKNKNDADITEQDMDTMEVSLLVMSIVADVPVLQKEEERNPLAEMMDSIFASVKQAGGDPSDVKFNVHKVEMPSGDKPGGMGIDDIMEKIFGNQGGIVAEPVVGDNETGPFGFGRKAPETPPVDDPNPSTGNDLDNPDDTK